MIPLVLALVLSYVGGETTTSLWNEMNCPDGQVVDAVCCEDKHCGELKSEKECHSATGATCLWAEEKCIENRDVRNNVCCLSSVGEMCGSITRGLCPPDHQVPSGCCSKEGSKWEGILSVNKTGFVCCNTPCKDMEDLGCEAPPHCHQRSHAGWSYQNLGFKSGLLDNYIKSPYPTKVGQVLPGLHFLGSQYGYGDSYAGHFPSKGLHDDDYSKSKHVEEITVDDLMNSLIEALSSDHDVFSFNQEVSSDPLFRKEKYGGLVDSFNFIKPDLFVDSIYGLPYSYGGGSRLGHSLHGHGASHYGGLSHSLGGGYGLSSHGGYGSSHHGGYGSSHHGGYGSSHHGGYGSSHNGGYGSSHNGGYGSSHNGGYGSSHHGGHGSSHHGGHGSSHHGGHGSSHHGGYGSSHHSGYGSSHHGGHGSSNHGGHGSSHQGGYGSSHQGGYGSSSHGNHGSQQGGYDSSHHGGSQAGYEASSESGYESSSHDSTAGTYQAPSTGGYDSADSGSYKAQDHGYDSSSHGSGYESSSHGSGYESSASYGGSAFGSSQAIHSSPVFSHGNFGQHGSSAGWGAVPYEAWRSNRAPQSSKKEKTDEKEPEN